MRVHDSRRGGILLGLLLTGLVFVCLVTAFGIYVASRVVVATHDGRDAHDVSIDLPGGHLSVRAHDHPGLSVAGVPTYPGARPQHDNSGGDAVVEWNSNGDTKDKGFAVSASGLVTDDPIDKVAAWYKKQLPDWIFEEKPGGEIHMELREGGYQRIVSLRERNGRTHIGVAAVGQPASN